MRISDWSSDVCLPISEDRVYIVGATCWQLRSQNGELVAAETEKPIATTPRLTGPASVVLRPGRPPRVVGLVLGAHAWHIDGDNVVPGAIAGPRIPLSG
jgi:hypothetical protein